MELLPTDRDWIVQQSLAAGFSLAGLVAVEQERENDRRLASWLAAGHAGEMDYLKRTDAAGNLLRADLRRSLPWARTVVVCAVNYNDPAAPLSIDPAPPGRGWIARYAWSGKDGRPTDYHDILLVQLRQVEAQMLGRFGGGGTNDRIKTRCYVDTGPLLERDLAARAGVGWIGKNTCVIHQQQGSWLLLGVIVTSLELAPEATAVAAADRCGSCTRCIDACPTDALMGDRQMDASRCIAYLTIEKKGSIAEELRAPMGRHIFGCDICQDVCPWNRKRPSSPAAPTPLPARPELINPSLDWLASLQGSDFTRVFRGSPVEPGRREATRRKRLRRNIALAMGNSGDMHFLPQLETWAASEDPVLAEAATWSLGRLQSQTSST